MTKHITPEELVGKTPVPDWAKGAEVRSGYPNETAVDDTWDLFAADEPAKHLGCMYDDGSGYRFAEGVHTRDLSDAITD